jgi:ornithine carbamoyltransferase
MVDLRGKSFLKLIDYTPEEINYLLDLSEDFKKKRHNHEPHKYLEGLNVALLFEKDSTRTRCSFEVAANELGMAPVYIGPTGSQMGKKESIRDTAEVLGRMFDGIEFRGFSQQAVEDLAKYSGVPVWNGLTDDFHPTQMLADVMTAKENFGYLKGLNWCFMGDGRDNVANSLMVVCSKLGINYTCCTAKELEPKQELKDICAKFAQESGSTITFTDDPMVGSKNADVIYTDVWVSMGEPTEKWGERINYLKKFQVTKEIMANANPKAIFEHCLPSFHNLETAIGKEVYEKYGLSELEVTDEVFTSNQSKVMDEAENRLHTIKAVMYATLKK